VSSVRAGGSRRRRPRPAAAVPRSQTRATTFPRYRQCGHSLDERACGTAAFSHQPTGRHVLGHRTAQLAPPVTVEHGECGGVPAFVCRLPGHAGGRADHRPGCPQPAKADHGLDRLPASASSIRRQASCQASAGRGRHEPPRWEWRGRAPGRRVRSRQCVPRCVPRFRRSSSPGAVPRPRRPEPLPWSRWRCLR